MRVPKNLQKEIEANHNGRYLAGGNIYVGKLSAGTILTSADGKTYPSALGYFVAKPDESSKMLFANNVMELYQLKCYRLANYSDNRYDELSDRERIEAKKSFFFSIKDLERDIFCGAELRDTKSGKMICCEVIGKGGSIGDHYRLMTKYRYDERGYREKGENAIIQEQKVAFAWVEEQFKDNEDPHLAFQTAVAKANGQDAFKYRLRINCFPAFLKNAYMVFESGGAKSTIKNVFNVCQNLENHISLITSFGNQFDISSIVFCLNTSIEKSDKYGESKKYPVTNLSFVDMAAKTYKYGNANGFLQLE
jgi:hypothetical protein